MTLRESKGHSSSLFSWYWTIQLGGDKHHAKFERNWFINVRTQVYFIKSSMQELLPWISPPRWPSGKASASRAEDPGFKSRLHRDFFGSSHTSDLKIGTPVATLPGAWRSRVSAGTGRPRVSILWLGEVECLICNFYLSVAARKTVWADPSLRYTSLLLGR